MSGNATAPLNRMKRAPLLGSVLGLGLSLVIGGCYIQASTRPPAGSQQGQRPPPPAPNAPASQRPRLVLSRRPIRPVAHVPLARTPSAAVARVIRADSPQGLGPHHLGVPLDANFNPMVGAGASTLFPQAGAPIVMPMNTMQHDQELVETTEQLKAALNYYVVSGGLGRDQSRRHAIYRALQVRELYELRDNTPMRKPPPGAVYYPWRIYMGHSYTEVLEGDERSFNAHVGATFLKFGGEAGAFTRAHSLQARQLGKGLVPIDGRAIFAQGPAEIATTYRAEGPAVPIVVEYRQIPNTQTDDAAIEWLQPKTVHVRFINIGIQQTGAAMYDYATWDMSFQCALNGQQVGSPQRYQQDFMAQNYPLPFSQQIQALNGDIIECNTWGQYLRANQWQFLGRSTTGPIHVNESVTPSHGVMTGREAKTHYDISWSAQ